MKRADENGFSIIEVVIALGLLAGVLISVAGLFVLGGRSVKSGRTASEALATSRQIVETLNTWGFTQLWSNFGYDGQAKTYTVDTNTCVTADCTGWQGTLRSKLGPTAHATIQLDSVAQGALTVPNFANAAGSALTKNVRITVNVAWTQVMGRTRQVSVVTSRN
jgi:Tfp pilus assembly protein PilV